jgi:hypothetical protein
MTSERNVIRSVRPTTGVEGKVRHEMATRKRKTRSSRRVAGGGRRTARRPARRSAGRRRTVGRKSGGGSRKLHIVVETVASNSVSRGGRPASVRETSVKRKGQF